MQNEVLMINPQNQCTNPIWSWLGILIWSTVMILGIGDLMESKLVLSSARPWSTSSSSAHWNVTVVIRIQLLKSLSDPPGASELHVESYDLRAIKGPAWAFPCIISWLEWVNHPTLAFGLAESTTNYLLLQEDVPTKCALFVSFSFGEEVNGQNITETTLLWVKRGVSLPHGSKLTKTLLKKAA